MGQDLQSWRWLLHRALLQSFLCEGWTHQCCSEWCGRSWGGRTNEQSDQTHTGAAQRAHLATEKNTTTHASAKHHSNVALAMLSATRVSRYGGRNPVTKLSPLVLQPPISTWEVPCRFIPESGQRLESSRTPACTEPCKEKETGGSPESKIQKFVLPLVSSSWLLFEQSW